MSRASRARRIVTTAAVGGTSIGALSAAAAGVIWGETKLARRRIKPSDMPPPHADGRWAANGVPDAGTPLRVGVLGDSTAAGYGLDDSRDTPAARCALGLSRIAGRPVEVRNVSVVGAESSALAEQVERLRAFRPQLAMVMIGANDVTHRVRSAVAVQHLAVAVTALRSIGCEVVVGTCPDLGTIRPIAQPLRFVARRISRNLAAAQTIAVVEAGGRSVSLGDMLGARFARERSLFGADAFHPSASGYAAAVEAMLPSLADALGLSTSTEAAGPFLTRRTRPVARAAARAVTHPGTEVAGASRAGSDTGRAGRWARLTRRRSDDTTDDPAFREDGPHGFREPSVRSDPSR